MKICYIAQSKSWHTQKWLEYFVQQGHEVHLIDVMTSDVAVCPQLSGITLHEPIEIRTLLNIPKVRGVERIIRERALIRKLVNDIKPDILHAHQVIPAGWWGALSGYHPFVVTGWGSEVLIAPHLSKLNAFMVKYTLSRADLITADSAHLIKTAVQFGAAENKSHVIRWGVDLRQFNLQVDKSKIKKALKLDENPVVLSPRGLRPLYNIDTIINSIPLVLDKIPNTKFIIKYGFGEQEDELKNLDRNLGVSDAVRFVGYVDYEEMPFYYASADVCVSVPSSESSPRSVFEAMACGAVPIVSDLPWVGELLLVNENTLVVPLRNHNALANAIITLLTDNVLYHRLRESNLKLVKDKADYHQQMAKMESLYQSLFQFAAS